jgi:hypothetical protein
VKRGALLLLCLWGAACGDRLEPALCDGGNCATQVSWQKTYQHNVNYKLDVLFVVDDTPAIAPYAATLAAGFADMARTLESLPQPASLHVGFVRAGTCDASTRGAACGLAAPEQFVRQEWCETITNFSGAFADTFACLSDLGAGDCAPAQPLAAAQQALATPPRPGWDGFLRPEAYLLAVVIAAADDASSAPVSEIASFIRGLKPDPSQTAASAIVPAGCAAAAPQRLTEFVESFGANGVLLDLCDAPLSPALRPVTEQISTIIEPACAFNVRDTDLETPGLQPSCAFIDHVVTADGSRADSSLPSCDADAPPCWRLVPGGYCAQGYVIDIERGPDWCSEAGENVTIECLACADASDPACRLPQAR